MGVREVARCDLAEVNHFMAADGRSEHYVQLIAWDWSNDYKRFDAQGYVSIQEWERFGDSVMVTLENGKRIELRCMYYRETWTKHDPETENRKLFPIQHRRKVWGPQGVQW